MTFLRFAAPLATLALALSAPALAQAAPAAAPAPAQAPTPPAPAAGGMMRDPFGDATVWRAQVQAEAGARFAVLDTDKDGSLSPAEMAAGRPARPGGAARSPRPGRGAGGAARMGDANGDGRIVREEFVAGSLRRFDMMDADRDGQLTRPERQAAMQAMRARIQERMREMAQSQLGGGAGD